MIKVLLVDDHDLVRLGIKKLLSDVPNIQIVGEANSGEKAIEIIEVTIQQNKFRFYLTWFWGKFGKKQCLHNLLILTFIKRA